MPLSAQGRPAPRRTRPALPTPQGSAAGGAQGPGDKRTFAFWRRLDTARGIGPHIGPGRGSAGAQRLCPGHAATWVAGGSAAVLVATAHGLYPWPIGRPCPSRPAPAEEAARAARAALPAKRPSGCRITMGDESFRSARSTGWDGCPQPRLNSASAAATRARPGSRGLVMIVTRVVTAASVCCRARSRTWASSLGRPPGLPDCPGFHEPAVGARCPAGELLENMWPPPFRAPSGLVTCAARTAGCTTTGHWRWTAEPVGGVELRTVRSTLWHASLERRLGCHGVSARPRGPGGSWARRLPGPAPSDLTSP